MPLLQILYVSGVTRAVNEAEIERILRVSRRNNPALGVTGMLLAGEGVFMQVLEGERKTVRKLFDRISGDDRHRNVMVLFESETTERSFAEWAMGFKKLDASRADDQRVFTTTLAALEHRIGKKDGGMVFDIVQGFCKDFVAAA